MNDQIDYYKTEFFGETSKYCIDGDYIWFYDAISGGVYRLDKNLYIVEAVLTPMEIHQKSIFPVRQILKRENEVYIIPNNISHDWLIYDITNKRLRRVSLSSQSYVIGNAVNIGEWIYLIPEKTSHIFAIVETATLKVKRIILNWYKNDCKEFDCWGCSISDDMIYFPIIGEKKIFRIEKEKFVEIPLDIDQSIYSISINENGIWILPSEGRTIFLMDRNGQFIDSVEIQSDYNMAVAKQFSRIIATDMYVYLFPKQGGSIWFLEITNKKWAVVGEKEEPLYRSSYQRERNIPYWGYYCNEKKLYMLPLQYRFAKINTEDKSIEYKVLQCPDTFTNREYMSWIYWFNKKARTNMHLEWERDSLRDFLRNRSEETIVDDIGMVGKSIWRMMKKL